tara:strand:+ start:49 stop:267 length:219 start_codon:yes stop_codon:yes gene_type:complete
MSSKVVSYFRNQKRKTGDSGSNYGQFQRAENREQDNYSVKLRDLDILPMKLRLDEKGNMTFKKGKVRTIRKN